MHAAMQGMRDAGTGFSRTCRHCMAAYGLSPVHTHRHGGAHPPLFVLAMGIGHQPAGLQHSDRRHVLIMADVLCRNVHPIDYLLCVWQQAAAMRPHMHTPVLLNMHTGITRPTPTSCSCSGLCCCDAHESIRALFGCDIHWHIHAEYGAGAAAVTRRTGRSKSCTTSTAHV